MKAELERKRFLLRLCRELDVDMSYFIDAKTGIMKENFKMLCEFRMSEIGIYSFAELSRRLGYEWRLLERIKGLDAKAVEENRELREFVNHEDGS